MFERRQWLERRQILAGTAALAAAGLAPAAKVATPMYGLIGKMLTAPGKRDEVLAILIDGTAAMPGCQSYVIAEDPTNPEAIWITEVWDSEASHQASLKLPAVQAAISKARPMIAGFGERFVTTPRGGLGLSST
jgi:quinol monooxygenase YgiN